MNEKSQPPLNPLGVSTSDKYPHQGSSYSAEEELEAEEERRRQNVVAVKTSQYNMDSTCLTDEQLKPYTTPREVEVPKFGTLADFQKFTYIVHCKQRIAIDQARFITENYAMKRIQISRNINELTRGQWKVNVSFENRVAYANYVNLVVCYTEMFYGIGRVMELDHNLGVRSFISCDVMDAFDSFFDVLVEAKETGAATPLHFAGLLDLRDKVVSSMRDHYLIALPIKQHKEVQYRKEVQENYQPYDYEWLAGNVTQENDQLPYVKFLAVSRRNQAELSSFRVSIVATHKDPNFHILRDVKCPFPSKSVNVEALDYAIYNRCNSNRRDFVRTYHHAKGGDEKESKTLLFSLRIEQFNEICEELRVKKNKLMTRISECDQKFLTAKFRMMSIIGSIESMMLVLSRVYGLFYDPLHGLQGRAIPGTVLITLRDTVKLLNEKLCYTKQIDTNVAVMLERLRADIHTAVEKFYLSHEEDCHKYYKDSALNPHKLYDHEMDIEPEHFDDSLGEHKKKLLWHLIIQKKEIYRLTRELHFAQRVPKMLSDKRTEQFCLNSLSDTNAFFSNALKVIDETEYENLKTSALNIYSEDPPQDFCGYQCFKEIKYLAKNYNVLPHRIELEVTMVKELEAAIGSQTVNGDSAQELAIRLARQIHHCIEANNLPSRYKRTMSHPITAHAAKRIISIYLHYIQQFMVNPPSIHREEDNNLAPISPDFAERILKENGEASSDSSDEYEEDQDDEDESENQDEDSVLE